MKIEPKHLSSDGGICRLSIYSLLLRDQIPHPPLFIETNQLPPPFPPSLGKGILGVEKYYEEGMD